VVLIEKEEMVMGNRAFVVPEGKTTGVYLHWNGGRDSVEAFLEYCKLRSFRNFGGKHADGYGLARFTQIVANFFGGDLSIGIEQDIKDSDADVCDNGIYYVGGESGWDIVRRVPEDICEQDAYDRIEMLIAIDKAQPKSERFGKKYFKATPISIDDIKVGDEIVFIGNIDGRAVSGKVCGKDKFDRWMIDKESKYGGNILVSKQGLRKIK